MPKTSPDAPDGGPTFTFHDLILLAVERLDGGRKGSSVQAIKKYILTQYGVEVSAKNSHHFKRGLETALEGESLIRVSGAGGVTGSFRLPSKTTKKSPPTEGNAIVRTTRKKSPPTNVDDVAAAMRNLAVRVTEQPGTSTGAVKTRAKGKMVAEDRWEVPATRKPVMKAAIARAPTSAGPSSSKGKNKNPQPAAATSGPTAVKTKPATALPTAAKTPATSRPNAMKTKPAPPIITKAATAAKSGPSAAIEKVTGRGKIVQKPEAAIGRTRATKNATAPSSASSGAVMAGKQKNKTQLPKSNGLPLKIPAKTATATQRKAKAKALVLSEESEEDEKPEEEDIIDGNNNSVTESVKEDDKDSEEGPDESEYENETNGTLIPPPSSSASHRSTNHVTSDSEESTDGEEVHNETSSSSHLSTNDVASEESTDGDEIHNETGVSATNVSVFDENLSSLDLSRQSHDRTTDSAMDMGGVDQMNSLTVEAPSSRDSNMTSSTTNNHLRQDQIKNEVVNESILDESEGDTTTYDEEIEESDVSQIEATKYVPHATEYPIQSEDEEEQETDDEGSTAIKTDTEDEVATEDEEGTGDYDATEVNSTKDEDAMELTDDEDEEYDVSRVEATSYVRDERAAVGNDEVTQVVPSSDDDESEEEESEDEETEDEESAVDESENGEPEEDDEGDDEEENSDEEE